MNKALIEELIKMSKETIESLEKNLQEAEEKEKAEKTACKDLLFCDALKIFMEDPEITKLYRKDWQPEDEECLRYLVSTINDDGIPVLIWEIDEEPTYLLYKPDPEDIFATDWQVA